MCYPVCEIVHIKYSFPANSPELEEEAGLVKYRVRIRTRFKIRFSARFRIMFRVGMV